MTPRAKIQALVIAAAAVGSFGFGYWKFYAQPRQIIEHGIASAKADVERLQGSIAEDEALARELKEFGARTLGKEQDEVSHRFRTFMSRMAEDNGLSGIVVDQGRPIPQRSPAAARFPSSVRSAARESNDFSVINGGLSGTGTLEQVLRTVAAVESQPWIHRTRGLSIRPVGREGDKFNLKMEVATLYAPDLVPADIEPEIALAPIEFEQFWRPVLAKNIFRVPPPERPPTGRTEIASAPKGPDAKPEVLAPAYGDWTLRGVVESSRGAQAMFVNTKTSQQVTVLVGGQVLDAKLVGVSGEHAILDINGTRFEVSNGETLAARKPVG